jgi:hypothetical protein
MDIVLKTILDLGKVKEKFAKIQENPSSSGAEYGLNNTELTQL